jgi:uncharacterized protein involved in type VI secretion and phage assembly
MATVQGVYSAQVLNNLDPERLGRVQVRVPGLPDGAAGGGLWARVASMTAGAIRGSLFVPDIGDEVLVAFENGDVRAPFVLGALWNGKDQPPESNDGKSTNRKPVPQAVAHTDLGGKLIVIDTPGGQRIRLADAPNAVRIEDANGNSVTLAASGVTVNAAAKVTIAASAVEIDAGMVTVNAAVAQFSGVVKCDRLVASAIVGPVQG